MEREKRRVWEAKERVSSIESTFAHSLQSIVEPSFMSMFAVET